MYKRHKIFGAILFSVIFLLSCLFKLDYTKIADSAISVVSIALGVYIGAASVILGSNFAGKLKSQPDSEIKTKTHLGVLATYLRIAGFLGIMTILVSSLYNLDIDIPLITEQLIKTSFGSWLINFLSVSFSSISCCLFAENLFFIWLILLFLINSLSKSTD